MNSTPSEQMQSLLDELTSDGTERGLQVAVYRDGQLWIDAWAGVADYASGRPVDGDTSFPVFSVTKGPAATLAHLAVDRGLLDYDQPIAGVWPEFAANGKAGITLRQALNHSAGLPHLPPHIDFSELGDWDAMCAEMAKLAPAFIPGSRLEYHAITYSWLVSEPVRRVDGRSFQQMLQEEIAGPLGVKSDMFVGIPDEVESRVAVLEEPDPPVPTAADQPASVPARLCPLHAFMNRPDMRRGCLPASSGIMTARAVAKHYASLLPGGVDGVQLLSDERLRLATAPQHLLNAQGEPAPWALGYQIYECYALEPGREVLPFGHGGYGGSAGFADPTRGIAVGFTKNLFNKQETMARIWKLIADAYRVDLLSVAGR